MKINPQVHDPDGQDNEGDIRVFAYEGQPLNKSRSAAEAVAQTVIKTADLRKSYDTGEVRVEALRGVDLNISAGEMVAVMGPSGCGKTTLLNCLSGIDRPTAGRIYIQGHDLYKMRDGARTNFRAHHMGFIFQFFNLLPVLSVVENVELPLLVSGARPAGARQRALEEIERIGLGAHSAKKPAELSGGQQQRVAIARALVNEPAIVWCDEPTGNLDSRTADEIMNLLCALNQEKRQTFVVVTHSDEVGNRTDRIVRMRDGLIDRDEKNGR
jgi:putative ABC transport system ATP-binding protein